MHSARQRRVDAGGRPADAVCAGRDGQPDALRAQLLQRGRRRRGHWRPDHARAAGCVRAQRPAQGGPLASLCANTPMQRRGRLVVCQSSACTKSLCLPQRRQAASCSAVRRQRSHGRSVGWGRPPRRATRAWRACMRKRPARETRRLYAPLVSTPHRTQDPRMPYKCPGGGAGEEVALEYSQPSMPVPGQPATGPVLRVASIMQACSGCPAGAALQASRRAR